MANLNLSSSCITYGAERPSERVKEFLQNSIVHKNQLSQYVSISSFEEKVPVERIPEVIEELRQYEEYCVQCEQYFEAEKCVKKVEALQKQEVRFSEKTIKTVNKSEMSELEEINLQQFKEFNDIWDKSIEDFQIELKQKEDQLIIIHEEQVMLFDENAKYIVFPATKYSPEVLQLRSLLDKLNKNKRYTESHEVKKRILELECRDEEKWATIQEKKIAGQRVLLQQRQKAELHALQTKLEDQLQLKIRTRKSEMNKYVLWLQNMKQELSVTHGLELSRIVAKGEKRTSRVSGGLCNTSMLLSQNYSQLLDMSKSYTATNSQQVNNNNHNSTAN